jgi:hypothetical protein
MRRSGLADLPLHDGRAPRWLFERMVRLAEAIVGCFLEEWGPYELLRRIADPFWFQAFGCVLGFDWHSSGLTTTTCGALKIALANIGPDSGVFAAGGKGATSRKTPMEIDSACTRLGLEAEPLIMASKLVAKVDSTAIQSGHQLYHHFFLFTKDGGWCIVQQGMHTSARTARRYHWLSENTIDFVDEPGQAICDDRRGVLLNLVARESAEAREVVVELAKAGPASAEGVFKFDDGSDRWLRLAHRHQITPADIDPKRLRSILLKTYEDPPEDFQALLARPGVGPKTLRALSLVAELVYGVPTSTRDPARFAFAHGGKDGIPFPVDREVYEATIEQLRSLLSASRAQASEKKAALQRLVLWASGT